MSGCRITSVAQALRSCRPEIRAVLFDLDDTLHDRESAFRSWLDATLACLLPERSQAKRRKIAQRICSIDQSGYGSKSDLVACFADLHPSWAMETEAAKERFYRELLEHMSLAPEVDRLLQSLEAQCIPYGIITNGSLRQWYKIERLGLKSRAACVFVSDEFGCKKPDPKVFLAAAEALQAQPETILFIGDHPHNDIGGAKQVGMRTAWLHRDKPWPDDPRLQPPDYVLDVLC